MFQCCSPCSQGRRLPQWILSHFRQTPSLTDHTAAFKGLSEHQRQLWFWIPVWALQPLELPPPRWKAQVHLLPPTAIFNDFPKTHSGFSGTAHRSGRVKWDIRSPLTAFWYEQSHSLSVLPLRDAHVPPVGKKRWCESGGREPEPQITALCASMTVWLAALHKILFTAHTEEKLQQQSSPEGGKPADLATLRERPEGGSGTIIIIWLPLIHCRYLYRSHSLWGIQPTDDNRLLVHKKKIQRQSSLFSMYKPGLAEAYSTCSYSTLVAY